MALKVKRQDPIGDFFGGVGGFVNDTGRNVGNFAHDVVNTSISTGQKVFNTGVAAATGVIGNFSSDPYIKQAAIDRRKDIFNNQRTITGDHATFFDNYNQAMNTNGNLIGNTMPAALRTVSEVSPYVIPFGKFTGTVPKQIMKAAGANAAFGTATNAASQLANTGKIDLGQLGQSAAISGVVGAAIPTASAFVKQARKVHATDPNPQAGSIKVPKVPMKQQPEVLLDGTKPSKFANVTAQGSQEVSDTLKSKVASAKTSYQAVSDQGRLDVANKFLKGKSDDAAYSSVIKRFEMKDFTDQDVVNSIQAIKKLDASATESNLAKASEIFDKLSTHLSKRGQEIQAASLLSNRTPQGLLYQAQRTLRKSGVEVTTDIQKELKTLVDKVKAQKPGSYEDGLARYHVMEAVEKKLPYSGSNKAVQVWKAGLLTAPTTTAGNVLANTGEQVYKHLWKDPVANGADVIMSLFTGKRSRSLTLKGVGGGAAEGWTKGVKYFKTGYDPRNPLTKFDVKNIHYSDTPLGKAAEEYTKTVFRLMGAQDQPFYYASFRNSLADQAITAAKNAGLKGGEKSSFIKKFVTEPSKAALDLADQEARYDVFQNKTTLGDMASGFKQNSGATGDFVVPFSQVPSSVATRIIERTPLGLAKEIVSQVKNKKFDQRAMTKALADGSAGVVMIGAGAALAANGLITRGFPQDQKERYLWELEGKQPNSVRIGDSWYSLNYLQPLGSLLAAGANYTEAVNSGKDQMSAASQALAGAAKALSEQSFLKGVSGVLSAINDPQRAAETFIDNTAGSVVPNIIRSVARSTDPVNREQNGVIESIQAGIPGARQQLPVRKDIFGQDVPRKTNALNSLFNPLRPSDVRDTTPLNQELRRLFDAGSAVSASQFNANSLGKDAAGNPIKLTKQQTTELEDMAGPQLKAAWDALIADPGYEKLTDGGKQRALQKVKEQINDKVKREYAAGRGIELSKKVTATKKKRVAKSRSARRRVARGRKSRYLNPYEYALSRSAGGSAPRVRVKKIGSGGTGRVAKKSTANPKVSVKKSMV